MNENVIAVKSDNASGFVFSKEHLQKLSDYPVIHESEFPCEADSNGGIGFAEIERWGKGV